MEKAARREKNLLDIGAGGRSKNDQRSKIQQFLSGIKMQGGY